jgi:hypothetical protein
MKTNELILLTASVTVIQFPNFSQVDSTFTNRTIANSTFETNAFKVLTGGINAVYSNDRAKGGIDLSVQTYHYYLITGKKKNSDTLMKSNQQNSLNKDYKGFEFFLLNRAALNFDSSGSIANDYITSLQSSPLTLRFLKELFLTKQHYISSSSYSPVFSIRLTGDGRAIPFQDVRNQLNFGTSGNFYVTLSSQFTRLQFDQRGKELERGTMYFQPSFGIAVGSKEMMKSVYTDGKNKPLLSSECRLGFKSHSKSINDCCLLFRYTLSDIIGPKLRAGIILSSFN